MKEYKVLNMRTKETWVGEAENAEEAYKNINKPRKWDTTVVFCKYKGHFRIVGVKEW